MDEFEGGIFEGIMLRGAKCHEMLSLIINRKIVQYESTAKIKKRPDEFWYFDPLLKVFGDFLAVLLVEGVFAVWPFFDNKTITVPLSLDHMAILTFSVRPRHIRPHLFLFFYVFILSLSLCCVNESIDVPLLWTLWVCLSFFIFIHLTWPLFLLLIFKLSFVVHLCSRFVNGCWYPETHSFPDVPSISTFFSLLFTPSTLII